MKRKRTTFANPKPKKKPNNDGDKKTMKLKEKLHKYHLGEVIINDEKLSQRSVKRIFKISLKRLPEGSLIDNIPRPSRSGELKFDITDMSDRSVLNIQGYGELLDHIVECTEKRRHARWTILSYGLEVENFTSTKRRGRPGKQCEHFGFYNTLSSSRAKYSSRLAKPITKLDIERYFASIMGMGIRKYTSIDSYFHYNEDHLGSFIYNIIFRFRFCK